MKFKHALVAGTFDHLHSGHQKLLLTALSSARHLSCGLTTKSLTLKKPLPSLILSPSSRRQELHRFLSSRSSHFTIFSLHHPLQPAASSSRFDTIIASQATAPTVAAINRLRQKNHLPSLHSTIIDLLPSTDHHSLSSTRIRQGNINRQGFAYHQLFPKNQPLLLPASARLHLRRPFDTLLSGSPTHLGWAGLQAKQLLQKHPAYLTIAVGDIAVISLLQQQLHLDLAIVDLKTQRRQIFSRLDKLGLPLQAHHTVSNPPSTITPQLIQALRSSFRSLLHSSSSPQTILVQGEEDLTVLPAILLSPLKTVIFYGQPHQGLVYIRVTEAAKQKALRLLQKFT